MNESKTDIKFNYDTKIIVKPRLFSYMLPLTQFKKKFKLIKKNKRKEIKKVWKKSLFIAPM